MDNCAATVLMAPVIVFAYKRPDKLKNCIEALEGNDHHDMADLFIFSDGSEGKEDDDKVAEVRLYLKEYEKSCTFKKLHVEYRDRHYGLARNVINGVTKIIKDYGKAVVVEDDLVVSGDYLSFINNALTYYEKDKRIWSVTGYTEKLRSLEGYKHDVYYGYRGCSYGWGTWKDRWETVDWKVKDYRDILKNPLIQWKMNRSGNSMMSMLRLQMEGRIDSWAIRWCLAQSRQDKYTVYPKYSLIRDEGADGSGTHVGQRRIMYGRMHVYGEEVKLESLRPDFLITAEYWYDHSDTLIKKLRRNRILRRMKGCFLKLKERFRG